MDFITTFVKTWSCCQNFFLHPTYTTSVLYVWIYITVVVQMCKRFQLSWHFIILLVQKIFFFSLYISFYYYWTIVVCVNKLHDYYRVRMNLHTIIVYICKMFQLLSDPNIFLRRNMSSDYLLSHIFLQLTRLLSCMYEFTRQQSCKFGRYSSCYDTYHSISTKITAFFTKYIIWLFIEL